MPDITYETDNHEDVYTCGSEAEDPINLGYQSDWFHNSDKSEGSLVDESLSSDDGFPGNDDCSKSHQVPITTVQSRSLYDDHVRIIQNISYLSPGEQAHRKGSKCITCTLVSYAELNNPEAPRMKHLAFLSLGHSPSVSSYKRICDGIAWRITTIHTKKNRNFVKQCEELLKIPLDQNPADYCPVTALAEIVQCNDGEEVHLVPSASGTSHLSIEINPDPWTVRFLLSTDTARDSVSGFLQTCDGYQCDRFHNSDESEGSLVEESFSSYESTSANNNSYESHEAPITTVKMCRETNMDIYSDYFKDMDKLSNENLVTVRVMWRKHQAGLFSLLHWVAGDFKGNRTPPEHGENWGIFTCSLHNNELYAKIVDGFQNDLLSQLNDTQKKKLLMNCSAFVVSEDQDCSAVKEPYPGETIIPAIHYVSGKVKKHVYDYQHSECRELAIKIHEPASPADAGYYAEDSMKPVMKDQIGLESRGIRQRKLEDEQVRLFHLLQALDESGGGQQSESVMTAIVSTLIDNYKTVSAVFLTQGICVDKGLGRLEVKTGPGWMTATRFITNRKLANSLDEAWKRESRKINDSTKMELFAGLRQFGCIDGESLENKKFHQLRIPDPTSKEARGKEISDMSVDSANATFTFDHKHGKFSLQTKEPRFMGKKGLQTYQPIPYFQSSQEHHRVRESMAAEVQRRLGIRETGNPPSSSPLTVFTVKAVTRLKQAKDKRARIGIEEKPIKTHLSIVIAGQHPDIVVPNKMHYCDPLTEISCRRDVGHNTMLAQAINEKWTSQSNEFDMAIFGAADLGTPSIEWKELLFNNNNKTVRLGGSPQLVEMWCHEARINPVYSVMIDEDEASMELLNEILKADHTHLPVLRQRFVGSYVDGKRFPISFHFPTLSIKYPWMPKPNHLGIQTPLTAALNAAQVSSHEGCLMHDKEDGVHFKMAKMGEGEILRIFGENDLDSLIEHHKAMQSRYKFTQGEQRPA